MTERLPFKSKGTTVKQVEPTGGQQRLLQRFSTLRGVVDFLFVESNNAASDETARLPEKQSSK
jgi:hypothetical protein